MACGPSISNSASPNTITTFCDLPMEILLEIVQHLDNAALLNLGLTCHRVHALALDTLLSNNKICDPKAGWLVAYKTPVETLPALRNALFVQNLDILNYYFNPPVERMLEEVRDLRALISRMPTTGLVKLHFVVVDQHFLREDPQVLNYEEWKEEFQGLLDLVLKKGCHELYVHGGGRLIELYSKHVDVEGARADIQQATNGRRERRKWKRLFGKVRLKSQVKRFIDFSNRFLPPVKLESHRRAMIKPTKVSIHSDMLLQNPFLEWTIATLNSGASTIRTLSMSVSNLPQEIWRKFLKSITLPRLSKFEITSAFARPLHGVCFTDLQSFLRHHPSIKVLHLFGMEVPESVQLAPSLALPILPRLKSFIAHPFYVMWILNCLLLKNKAPPNLTDIGISSEFHKNAATSDYALFDDVLERVAASPVRKIKLMLRFASTGEGDMNDWFESHISQANDASTTPSVISRLKNVTSIAVSAFWFAEFNGKTMELLPQWLGMFPNVTAIEFADQPEGNLPKLEDKEFVRKVAMACPKAQELSVSWQKIRLDEVRGGLPKLT